ncbi:MAG TPA: NAD-dependent epimerase/dehydratase family protein [Candidatus Limnocylindria bacterium]|nr:NAD-dependent epimerase/dehydratase family protein [Candidatus Limnocylindria bacterium]
MQIFLAGATGAIGRQLVPSLIAAGHEVSGTTRSEERAAWLAAAGARPVIVDAYDAEALRAALVAARPEVVIDQLTDLARGFSAEDVASTGRLREVTTATLAEAALAAGARRLVAQSGAWQYADGPIPHDETHPLRTPTDEPKDAGLRGIIALERIVLGTPGIDGIVLRYGYLYGPGTAYTPEDAPDLKVSVEGAARATAAAAAVHHGPPGIYNVVDDIADVSNAKARELLGWTP